jgi:hypothetical protein
VSGVDPAERVPAERVALHVRLDALLDRRERIEAHQAGCYARGAEPMPPHGKAADLNARDGSVRRNAPIVRRGGVGRLHAPPPQARQPVSLLQLVTRGDPPRGHDVRAVSAVAAQRGSVRLRCTDR